MARQPRPALATGTSEGTAVAAVQDHHLGVGPAFLQPVLLIEQAVAREVDHDKVGRPAIVKEILYG
jgi:hypothetical protein